MIRRHILAFAALLAITAFALAPATAAAQGHGHGHAHGGSPAFHGSAPAFHSAAPAFHSAAPAFRGTAPAFHGTAPAFRGSGFHDGRSYGSRFHEGRFHDGRFFGGFYGLGFGLGYPWYGGYGYGPGYYDYGYSPGYYGGAYYDAYPAYPAVTNYNYLYGGTPGYDVMPYADVTPPEVDYGAVAPAADSKAHIRVTVPADDAQVWFNGTATQQGGRVREFESPSLTPGREFVYDVKARWRDADGKEVTRTQEVDVRAGSHVAVDFLRPGSDR